VRKRKIGIERLKNPDLSHLEKMDWYELWCTKETAKSWIEGLSAAVNPGLVIYFSRVKERAEELLKDNRP